MFVTRENSNAHLVNVELSVWFSQELTFDWEFDSIKAAHNILIIYF